MKFALGILWFLAMLLAVQWAPAAGTNFNLQGGGSVNVDPDTNRATVTRGGVTTPLWDGTHRMQDGSILIINRGVAVPNASTLQPEQLPPPEVQEWEGAPIVGYSPCEKLVRRTCGRENQCAGAEGCILAGQLLDMEQDERAASKNPNRMTYSSGQCLNVVTDAELFPLCPQQGR
jgi:hypothetical protein